MRNAKLFVAFGLGIATTALVSAALPLQEEAMPAEAAAAMDEMNMQAMMPGEMHRRLAPLEGDWTMEVKWRMTPDGEWIQSPAEAHREWLFGGRFMVEKVKGKTPMGPFQGMALMGYDNLREEFVSVWIDDSSTGFHIGTGKALDNPKVIETEGTVSDAMSGDKAKWFRDRIEIKSKNEQTYQAFHKDADGREYLAMEIVSKKK